MKNSHYDISLIRRYLNGELDAAAMYNLERQAQDDPMLMDLIQGMESGDEREHRDALVDIDLMISQRTNPRSRRTIAWGSLGIAASVLIALSIAVLFLVPEKPSRTTANQKPIKSALPKKEILKPADPLQTPASLADESLEFSAKTPAIKQGKPSAKLKETSAYQENMMATLNQKNDTSSNLLNEVLIVGYATQKKSDLTGAVKQIASTSLSSDSLSTVLTGRVAGVQTKGKKGAEIVIRGTNRFNGTEEIKSVLSGLVTDKVDKRPLPGVLVRVKGTIISATTDINGKFRIGLPDNDAELELIFIGYEKELVKINKQNNLEIALNPSMSALNEVVVVGYGTQQGESTEHKPAQPAEGWSVLRKYLKDHAKAIKKENEGVVVLSFTVSPYGKISDVKIIQGINEETDQKAVNLLINGPKWTGDSDGLSKEVRLRMRFR